MPEGDTIFRTAARLRDFMVDHPLEAPRSPSRELNEDALAKLENQTVTSIESRGKHLLIHLQNELCVHSHMGMHGAWLAWQQSEHSLRPIEHAALVLNCNAREVACFYPKTLEVLTQAGLRRHAHLPNLGPDLLSESLDEQQLLARLRATGELPIGEAIMDQRVMAGIGNVYKSELLFELQLNPFAPVAAYTDEQLARLIERARRQLRRNALTSQGSSRRQTRLATDGSRFWVYGRSGQRCLRCGQVIHMGRQGALQRSTYWCPECQKPGKLAGF